MTWARPPCNMSEHVHYPPGHVYTWTALLSQATEVLHPTFSHTHLLLDKLEGRALLKGERLFLCIMDQPHGLWPARALCGPQRDVFERDEKALLCCLKQLQQRKSVIYVAWQAHVCVCVCVCVCMCMPVAVPVLSSSSVQVVMIVTADRWYQRWADAVSLSRWCCWISQHVSAAPPLCECVCVCVCVCVRERDR